MKKTFKTMLALMAGAVAFTACSNDDITENINNQKTSALKPMTFTASMEDGASRAAIDGPDIKWVTGDKIGIFDGSTENNGNQEFTLTAGAGSTSGTFEGNAAEASTYYALYPYPASFIENRVPTKKEAMAAGEGVDDIDWCFDMWKKYLEWDEEDMVKSEMSYYGISNENQAIILAYLKNQTITYKSDVQRNGNQFENVVLPAEQTVAEGQYVDPKAMLMIGESDNYNSLQFNNVCAYVKVTPEFDCKAIRLISKGTESLAGTVTLDYNGGTPTANVTANGVSKVSLTGTIKANNAYYIAVLPATLNSGFTIRFVTIDDIYNKSTTKALPLVRNKVIDLGSFDTSDMIRIPKTGTAEATIGGETVNVPWVQLWKDGPKFAEYNVGATSVTEYGGYYTWGGTYNNGQGIAWTADQNTSLSKLSGNTDTATKLWGNYWRMPTNDELGKYKGEDWPSGSLCGGLLYECTCTWVTNYNGTGVNGLLCTGKEDYIYNSIFLPAAGYSENTSGVGKVWGLGMRCDYWTSIPKPEGYEYDEHAYSLDYTDHVATNTYRDQGISVRAVLNE